MNQNPIIKALQDDLAKERDVLSPKYVHENHIAPVHDAWNRYNIIYKSGHEAASARLLPLIQKAVEMAEYYGNRENWKTKGSRFGKPLTELEHYDSDGADDLGGKKAREFLTTLAGEIKKDGK